MHRAIEAGIVDFLYENNLVRLGNDIVAEVNFPNKTEIGLRKQFNKLTYWKGTTSKAKTESRGEICIHKMPNWKDANLCSLYMSC